jgi:hypothetical protein
LSQASAPDHNLAPRYRVASVVSAPVLGVRLFGPRYGALNPEVSCST